MESVNSSPSSSSNSVEAEEAITEKSPEQWFNEQFENLLPRIQERWPDLAKHTLEATKGSLDDLINVTTRGLAESLEPLEKQLEDLLDELNSSLRPRIEKPVRKRPLLAIGIAAGIGVLFGILLGGGSRN